MGLNAMHEPTSQLKHAIVAGTAIARRLAGQGWPVILAGRRCACGGGRRDHGRRRGAPDRRRTRRNADGHIIQIASAASGGAWNMKIAYGTAKGAPLNFRLHLANQLDQEAAKGGAADTFALPLPGQGRAAGHAVPVPAPGPSGAIG